MGLGKGADEVHKGRAKDALKAGRERKGPLPFRGGKRVGRVLGDPDEEVKCRAKNEVEFNGRGSGRMERLANQVSHEDGAKMKKLVRDAVKPGSRIPGPQQEGDDPTEGGNQVFRKRKLMLRGIMP